jgi:hypothetical protein
VQYLQMGFDVITRYQRMEYAKGKPVAVGGISMTLEERIAAHRRTIAWLEEQLAQTRSWRSQGKDCFAKPDDWITIANEFEAELEELLGIAQGVAA